MFCGIQCITFKLCYFRNVLYHCLKLSSYGIRNKYKTCSIWWWRQKLETWSTWLALQEEHLPITTFLSIRLDPLSHAWLILWYKKYISQDTGPLFTKRADVLRQDLAKSRSRAIRVLTCPIALKFDRHLGSTAAEMSVKFQSDTIIITPHLAASRLREIWR